MASQSVHNEVGIRELRAHLSAWLDRVEDGEMITVTARGKPIARISPIKRSDAYERLLAAGLIYPPTGPKTRARRRDRVRANGSVSDLVRDQRR